MHIIWNVPFEPGSVCVCWGGGRERKRERKKKKDILTYNEKGAWGTTKKKRNRKRLRTTALQRNLVGKPLATLHSLPLPAIEDCR